MTTPPPSLVARLASRLRSALTLSASMPVAVPRSPSPSAPSGPAPKRQRVEGGANDSAVAPSATTSDNATAGPSSPPKRKSAKPPFPPPQRPPAPSFRPLDTVPTAEDLAAIETVMALPLERERPAYAYQPSYRDALVLAPMVRSGTLPARLLSLYHGAGLVWTPEIVDKAIIGAQRDVDPVTGVITYHKGGSAIWTTHPVEKPFLIYQIGTSDPELAVKAAQTVAQDVSGIDLNCGCPKPFSTHSGMGAALLSTPDLLLDILRALVASIPLPISAKIRLMPTRAETMLLAARILRTGISNLTVHCRTRDMRPGEPAIHTRLAEVVALGVRRGLPVICNGDGDGYANWDAIRSTTGATSVMLARAAEKNPSVFRPAGPLCATTVVTPQLLSVAAYTGNSWGNTKFLLTQCRPSPPPVGRLSKVQKKAAMEAISRAKSPEAVVENMRAMGVVADMVADAGLGKKFMVDLADMLKARPEWNVWAERVKAVEAGTIVDAVAEEGEEMSRSTSVAEEEAANAVAAGEEEAADGVAVGEEEAANSAPAPAEVDEEEAANEPVRAAA